MNVERNIGINTYSVCQARKRKLIICRVRNPTDGMAASMARVFNAEHNHLGHEHHEHFDPFDEKEGVRLARHRLFDTIPRIRWSYGIIVGAWSWIRVCITDMKGTDITTNTITTDIIIMVMPITTDTTEQCYKTYPTTVRIESRSTMIQ